MVSWRKQLTNAAFPHPDSVLTRLHPPPRACDSATDGNDHQKVCHESTSPEHFLLQTSSNSTQWGQFCLAFLVKPVPLPRSLHLNKRPQGSSCSENSNSPFLILSATLSQPVPWSNWRGKQKIIPNKLCRWRARLCRKEAEAAAWTAPWCKGLWESMFQQVLPRAV